MTSDQRPETETETKTETETEAEAEAETEAETETETETEKAAVWLGPLWLEIVRPSGLPRQRERPEVARKACWPRGCSWRSARRWFF